MKKIDARLRDFKYIYKKNILNINFWHCTFDMGSGLPEIQMSIQFCDTYVDILSFPHPVIVNESNYDNLLNTINYINWSIKINGRFYIDHYNDIAYSLRLKYETMERMPEMYVLCNTKV